MTEWTTVYDFADEGLRGGGIFIPASFVLIGYGAAAYHIFFRRSGTIPRIFTIAFGIIFGTFALFFSYVTISHNIAAYKESKKMYRDAGFTVVEGIVENFKPMPYTGHMNESFTLNGITFRYSDFDESYYGFNNTQSHGGPISRNRRVRLSYYSSGDRNIILKIEVPK